MECKSMKIKTTLIAATILFGSVAGLSFAYPAAPPLGDFECISERYTSLTGMVKGASHNPADARLKALSALPSRARVTGDRMIRHSGVGETWWEIDLYWKIHR